MVLKTESKFHFLTSVKIRRGVEKNSEQADRVDTRPNLWCTFDGRLLRGLED